MLSVMRKSWSLFALFALVTLTSAMSIDDVLHIDGIEEYLHNGVKRQAGTGVSETPSQTPTPTSDTPSSSDSPTPSSSEDRPSSTPTEQPTSEKPSSTPPETSSSDTPSQTNNAPSSTPPKTSASSTPPASSKTSITAPITRTTPLLSTSVSQFVTVFTTVSDGQQVAITSTGTSSSVLTTGTATTTELPSAQDGGDNGGSGGLSDTNKKVIGGVVGGIGGAILLGGLAVVAWRIWGRKKRVSEDDDDLMAGTGSALGDKPHSASTGNTPFQSNLEQYHNPGGRPNAAANF